MLDDKKKKPAAAPPPPDDIDREMRSLGLLRDEKPDQSAGGVSKIRKAAERLRSLKIDVPDDVVDDFDKVTGLESGRSHFNRDGSVKRGVPTRDGTRAIGYGQIMPGTAKPYTDKYGLDPETEEDNIAMSLAEYHRGSDDPVGRRIAYVGGSKSPALRQYKKTGQVPKTKLYSFLPKNKETFHSYVERSGGFENHIPVTKESFDFDSFAADLMGDRRPAKSHTPAEPSPTFPQDGPRTLEPGQAFYAGDEERGSGPAPSVPTKDLAQMSPEELDAERLKNGVTATPGSKGFKYQFEVDGKIANDLKYTGSFNDKYFAKDADGNNWEFDQLARSWKSTQPLPMKLKLSDGSELVEDGPAAEDGARRMRSKNGKIFLATENERTTDENGNESVSYAIVPEQAAKPGSKLKAVSGGKVREKNTVTVAEEARNYGFEQTGRMKLKDGTELGLVTDAADVPEGKNRFRDADGETYLFDRESGRLEDESLREVTARIPVSRAPITSDLNSARQLRANQIAGTVALQHGIDSEDAEAWLMNRGFVDPDTGEDLARDRYYKTRDQIVPSLRNDDPDTPDDFHQLTRRDLRDVILFGREQKAKRLGVVQKMISEGEQPSPELLRKLKLTQSDLNADWDAMQMAATQGKVAKAQLDQLIPRFKQTGADDYQAKIQAKRAMGFIDAKTAAGELDAYDRLKAEQTERYRNLQTGQPQVTTGKAAMIAFPQQSFQEKAAETTARVVEKYGSAASYAQFKQAEADAEAERLKRIEAMPFLEKWSERLGKAPVRVVKGAINTLVAESLRGAVVWTKPLVDFVEAQTGLAPSVKRVEDHPMYRAGNTVEKYTNWLLKTNKDIDQEFLAGKLPTVVGTSLAMMLPSLGKDPRKAIALYSTLQMGGGSFNEAKQAGASDDDALKFALVNSGLFGWTETLGIGKALIRLKSFNAGAYKQFFNQLAKSAPNEIAEEVILNEGPQTIGANVLAQAFYDPAREWDKDLAENLMLAGLSAGGVSTLVTAANSVRNSRAIRAQLENDKAHGGPAFRNFGESGVFVHGQQIQVTPEIEPAIANHKAILDEIKLHQAAIRSVRDRAAANPDNVARMESFRVARELQEKVGDLYTRQAEAAEKIVGLSGVKAPDPIELRDRWEDAANFSHGNLSETETPEVDISGGLNPAVTDDGFDATLTDGRRVKILDDRGESLKVEDENDRITLQPVRKFKDLEQFRSEAQKSSTPETPQTQAEMPAVAQSPQDDAKFVHERPVTLEAQTDAMRDPETSAAIAVLFTDPKAELSAEGTSRFVLPDGTLVVNNDKFKAKYGVHPVRRKLNIESGRIPHEDLIGGKAVPDRDTTQGTAVVTVDAEGNELNSSKISDKPVEQWVDEDRANASRQMEMDKARFGEQAASVGIADTAEIIASREEDRPIDAKGFEITGNKTESIGIAGLAEKRKNAQNAAYVDQMTGLGSGRAFEFSKERDKTRKGDKWYAALDFNGTKGLNDNFGHEFTDSRFKEVAKAMRRAATELAISDRGLFHQSGDEFAATGDGPADLGQKFVDLVEKYAGVQVHEKDGKKFVSSVSGTVAGTYADADAKNTAHKTRQKIAQAKEHGAEHPKDREGKPLVDPDAAAADEIPAGKRSRAVIEPPKTVTTVTQPNREKTGLEKYEDRKLARLGFTASDIDAMAPEERKRILTEKITKRDLNRKIEKVIRPVPIARPLLIDVSLNVRSRLRKKNTARRLHKLGYVFAVEISRVRVTGIPPGTTEGEVAGTFETTVYNVDEERRSKIGQGNVENLRSLKRASLGQAVRAAGGMKGGTYASTKHSKRLEGELERFRGFTGVINKNSAYTAEDMAQHMQDLGYFPRSTDDYGGGQLDPGVFLEALEADLAGQQKYFPVYGGALAEEGNSVVEDEAARAEREGHVHAILSSLSEEEFELTKTIAALLNDAAVWELIEQTEFTGEISQNSLNTIAEIGLNYGLLRDETETAIEALLRSFRRWNDQDEGTAEIGAETDEERYLVSGFGSQGDPFEKEDLYILEAPDQDIGSDLPDYDDSLFPNEDEATDEDLERLAIMEANAESSPDATAAAHDAATSPLNDLPDPTEAQIEAGNYKMGHIRISGVDISIENPAGSERKGTDADGKSWSVTMRSHYGYIKRSKGADEEHIDVFVKDSTPADFSGDVYVIDQNDQEGNFDEHKVMLGFASDAEAKTAYAVNYTADWTGLGSVAAMPMSEFKDWIAEEQKAPASVSHLDTPEKLEANRQAYIAAYREDPSGFGQKARIGDAPDIDESADIYPAKPLPTPEELAAEDSVSELSKTPEQAGFGFTDGGGLFSDNGPAPIEAGPSSENEDDRKKRLAEFAAKTAEKVANETISAYGETTGPYLNTLAASNGPIRQIAETLIKLRNLVLDKGEEAKQLVEDAADALDLFINSQSQNRDVDEVLKQPRLDGKTFSGTAQDLARSMESGEFGEEFRGRLNAVEIPLLKSVLAAGDDAAKKRWLEGMEPVPVDTSAFNGLSHPKDLREAGKSEYSKLVNGPEVTNVHDGKKIRFTNKQFKKFKQHSADPKVIKIVSSLPELLKNAVPLFTEAELFPAKYQNITGWNSYAAKAEIDGETNFVLLTTFDIKDSGTYISIHHDHNVTPANKLRGPAGGPASVTNQAASTQNLSKNRLYQWWNSVNENPLKSALSSEAPTFYSQLEKTVEEKMPAKASAEQVRGIVSTGVKREELDWLGLDQFLDSKSILTKEEVLEFVRHNSPEISEVVKRPGEGTKYNNYALPGGENYRELLLTLQSGTHGVDALAFEMYGRPFDELAGGPKAEVLNRKAKRSHRSRHWDESNVLVHVRFDERDRGRTLHIAEIQSDWHQEGRQRGYARKFDPTSVIITKRPATKEDVQDDDIFGTLSIPKGLKEGDTVYAVRYGEETAEFLEDSEASANARIRDVFDRHLRNPSAVADGPFKKSWHELALKKMLRYAVENDYDRLTWDTGETNNNRYDLAQAVHSIEYSSVPGGGRKISIHYKVEDLRATFSVNERGEVSVSDMPGLAGKTLEAVVGRKLAEEILKGETGKIEGDGLTVGGAGMVGFYDKILTAFVRKYVKKWGASVEPYDYHIDDGEKLDNVSAHSVTITPAMRESVLAGQPLFKKRSKDAVDLMNDELPKAHTQEIFDGIVSLFNGDDLYINEFGSEQIRRLLGTEKFNRTGEDRYEDAFDGITVGSGQLRSLAALGRELRVDYSAVGYADDQLARYDELLANLDRLAAKTEFGVMFTFDDVLPEEHFHQEDLRAGRTDQIAIAQLKESAIWQNPGIRFTNEYAGISDADKTSEIAAKLATDQAGKYGWSSLPDFENVRKEMLAIWAQGVFRRNKAVIQSEGVDSFIKKFRRIGFHAGFTETDSSRVRKTEARGSSGRKQTALGKVERSDKGSDKAARQASRPDRSAEEQSSVEIDGLDAAALGVTLGDVRVKNRQFARSLRESGRDATDVPYVPESEIGWINDAKAVLQESLSRADAAAFAQHDYSHAIDVFENPETPLSTKVALGIALIDHLGSTGDYSMMLRIGDMTTKIVGTAAQALRACQLVSKYDFARGVELARRALEKRGKQLSPKEINKIKELSKLYNASVREKAVVEQTLRDAEEILQEQHDDIEQLRDAVAEAEGQKGISQAIADEMAATVAAREAEIKSRDSAIDEHLGEIAERDDLIGNLKRQLERWKKKREAEKQGTVRRSRTHKDLLDRQQAIRQALAAAFPGRPLKSSIAPLRSVVTSPAEFDDQTRQLLVDYAALQIFEGESYEATIDAISELTQGVLTESEISAIHADAVDTTAGAKVERDPAAVEKLKLRNEHKRKAKAFREGKPVDAHKAGGLSRLETEMLELSEDNEKLGAAAVFLNNSRNADDFTRAMRSAYPETPKAELDDLFVHARELRSKARKKVQRDLDNLRSDMSLTQEVFDEYQGKKARAASAERKNRGSLDMLYRQLQKSLPTRILETAFQVVSIPKTLMSGGEVSYIGRQGFLPLVLFTGDAIRGLKGVAAGFRTETGRLIYEESLRTHKHFDRAQAAGTVFSQIGDFNLQDEHFNAGKIFEAAAEANFKKLPGFVNKGIRAVGKTQQAFEHAYTLPGDAQRLFIVGQLFDLIDDQPDLPPHKREVAEKTAAKIANAFTGKSNLQIFKRDNLLTKFLSAIGFAPSYVGSRFEASFYLSPVGLLTAPRGLRAMLAKKALRFHGIMFALAVASAMVLDADGDDDERSRWDIIDPSSKSFLKGRIRGTDLKFDLTANMSEPMRLLLYNAVGSAYFAATGQWTKLGDIWKQERERYIYTDSGEPLRYFRGKLSPFGSFVYDAASRKDYLGRDVKSAGDIGVAVLQRLWPLTYQQTVESLTSDQATELMRPGLAEAKLQQWENVKRGDLNFVNAALVFVTSALGANFQDFAELEKSRAEVKAWDIWEGFTSKKKTPEQKSIDSGIRRIYRFREEQLRRGKDTSVLDRRLSEILAANGVDAEAAAALKEMATGSRFKFVTKQFSEEQLRMLIDEYATDRERPELEKYLAAAIDKKDKPAKERKSLQEKLHRSDVEASVKLYTENEARFTPQQKLEARNKLRSKAMNSNNRRQMSAGDYDSVKRIFPNFPPHRSSTKTAKRIRGLDSLKGVY